jgi:phage terminase large subunit
VNSSDDLTEEQLKELGLVIQQVTSPSLRLDNQISPVSSVVDTSRVDKEDIRDDSTNSVNNASKDRVTDLDTSGDTGVSNSYGGDEEDNSLPLHNNRWEALDGFKDSAAIAEFFDEEINSGAVTLYPWQVEVSVDLCSAKPTKLHPHKFCLCACNGSGKDAYVIAPFVIWFALTKIQSLTIITSSSGVQLTSQTEGYIRRLAEKVNTYFGEPFFKINQRFIKCLKTGSEIRLFATDEAGKAEGYHPISPNAEMAIIVNEAKSVSPEIFGALKRCTGYNYWLNVSTPGEPYGDFYKSFTNWPNKRHVSTFDCPNHLSASEREEEKLELGEHSALYRSKHLALFTSLGGQVIIPAELVESVIRRETDGYLPKKFQEWPLRIGGDLAAGGDETVLTGVRGNNIEEQVCFIQKDTVLASDIIEHHLLHTFRVKKDHQHIYMDDGGVGRGIIDNLQRRGWTINRILNQSPAVNKKEFGNRGAEAWYRMKRIVEESLFRLTVKGKVDKKLLDQLSNRYYKQQSTQGRITLEAKKDAKAHGRPSPDRADSLLLALTGLTIDDFLQETKHGPISPAVRGRTGGVGLTTQEMRDHYEDTETYKNFENKLKEKPKNKPLYGSLSSWLKRAAN